MSTIINHNHMAAWAQWHRKVAQDLLREAKIRSAFEPDESRMMKSQARRLYYLAQQIAEKDCRA